MKFTSYFHIVIYSSSTHNSEIQNPGDQNFLRIRAIRVEYFRTYNHTLYYNIEKEKHKLKQQLFER